MKTVTILLILLVNNFCTAQLASNNNVSYYEELSKEANKEHPNSPYEVVQLDSFFNFIFGEGKAYMKMDTSFYWKVLFETSLVWTHDVINEIEVVLSLDSIQNSGQEEYPNNILISPHISDSSQKNIKFIYDSSKVYHGKELFRGLDIDSMFLSCDPKPWLKIWNHDSDSLKCFPQIYERDDPLNGKWTPIICDDYLIVRLVQCYSDVNQTSFYNEVIFLFKKQNH